MNESLETHGVMAAMADLRQRSLGRISRPLDRLIYLSSMRDCNTGVYYHEGLASRFTQEIACEAIARCHFEVFLEMSAAPLEDIVDQMEAYIVSTHTYAGDFVSVWKGLEPYRVAVPVDTDPLVSEVLFSNFKLALAILESRLHSRSAAGSNASPQPTPVR